MLNVNPSAPPFLTSSNRERLGLDMATRLTPAQPDSVTERSVFDEQLEDPAYLNYLDEIARNGYGFSNW